MEVIPRIELLDTLGNNKYEEHPLDSRLDAESEEKSSEEVAEKLGL